MKHTYVRIGEIILIASCFISAVVLFADIVPVTKLTVGITTMGLPIIGVFIMVVGGEYETRVRLTVKS